MQHQEMKIDKPWGYELIIASTPHYIGKILVISAGHELSLQYHEIKDESIYVIEGEMTLEIESDGSMQKRQMKTGDLQHIPPGTLHRFSTKKGCRIVEVSTPQLEDVVRIEDRYGRIQS